MPDFNKLVSNPVAVLREEFDDWAVLFNPDTADVIGISPVGVAVWKLLDGSRENSDIVNAIKDSYSEVPETVGEEVAAFIEDLKARGFMGCLG